MRPSQEILNWLILGLELPSGSIMETFYFDRRDNEFFSVVLFDYFLIDENLNRSLDVTTDYSKFQESSLIDRIKRIEIKDPTIIPIPMVSLDDRKNVMQKFVDTLSDPRLIDILNQRIKNQDYSTKFDFYFGDDADIVTKQKWEETKLQFLYQEVDKILNLNKINVDTATLWLENNGNSIQINIKPTQTQENQIEVDKTQNKNPWWKFW
jgi:hypothetical protein